MILWRGGRQDLDPVCEWAKLEMRGPEHRVGDAVLLLLDRFVHNLHETKERHRAIDGSIEALADGLEAECISRGQFALK